MTHDTTDQKAWEAAYCDAFRRVARDRGWSDTHIESGWLDEWPREAWLHCGLTGTSPEDAASVDVPEAEAEAANA